MVGQRRRSPPPPAVERNTHTGGDGGTRERIAGGAGAHASGGTADAAEQSEEETITAEIERMKQQLGIPAHATLERVAEKETPRDLAETEMEAVEAPRSRVRRTKSVGTQTEPTTRNCPGCALLAQGPKEHGTASAAPRTWSEVVKRGGGKGDTNGETRSTEKNEEGQGDNPSETGRKLGRRRKRPVRNPVAILAHREGMEYETLLKDLKNRIGEKVREHPARSVRRTRAGDLLIELEKEGEVEVWMDAIRRSYGDDRTNITELGTTDTFKVRNLDALVTESEIVQAVAENTGCEPEKVQVIRTFKYPWEERAAIVRAPTKVAEELRKGRRLKIGFVCAKIVTEAGTGASAARTQKQGPGQQQQQQQQTQEGQQQRQQQRREPPKNQQRQQSRQQQQESEQMSDAHADEESSLGTEIDRAIEQVRGLEEGPSWDSDSEYQRM